MPHYREFRTIVHVLEQQCGVPAAPLLLFGQQRRLALLEPLPELVLPFSECPTNPFSVPIAIRVNIPCAKHTGSFLAMCLHLALGTDRKDWKLKLTRQRRSSSF
jgi:hypothetical protein